MTYAKHIKNGVVTGVAWFSSDPSKNENFDGIIITKEEYDALRAEMNSGKVETDEVSPSEALSIILGGAAE